MAELDEIGRLKAERPAEHPPLGTLFYYIEW